MEGDEEVPGGKLVSWLMDWEMCKAHIITAMAQRGPVPGAKAKQPIMSMPTPTTAQPPMNTRRRPSLSKVNQLMTMKIMASPNPPIPISKE